MNKKIFDPSFINCFHTNAPTLAAQAPPVLKTASREPKKYTTNSQTQAL